MIGRTNTGGGITLHIRSGTTEPLSPSEGTIWVNTSVPVTGYAAGFDAPTSVFEGLLFIRLMSSGGHDFSVTPKGNIVFRVGTVTQYTNGAWVGKDAYIYRNDAWEQLVGWIYNNGEKYMTFTGGITFTKNSNGIYEDKSVTDGYFFLSREATTAARFSAGLTVNRIDMTPFSKIHYRVTPKDTNVGTIYLAVMNDNTVGTAWTASNKTVKYIAVSTFTKDISTELELDISDVNGEYYPGIQASAGVRVEVHGMWFT